MLCDIAGSLTKVGNLGDVAATVGAVRLQQHIGRL